MRLIGHVKGEESAKILADYLVSIEVKNQVEPDGASWAVWIYAEEQIVAGQKALADFLENPNDPKFRAARHLVQAIEERKRAEDTRFQKRVRTADQIWFSAGLGQVTLTLMIISIAVTAMKMLDLPIPVYDWFSISNYIRPELPEIREGQIWRLLTPIFLHFGILHIAFNMMMLRTLGSHIESRQGAKTLIGLVVVIGIGSNLGQYFLAGPSFGGMSGVLYGLLGYIWIRAQSDPASGLFIDASTVGMMLIWFALCLFGLLGNVANGCHAFGLMIGMVIGALPWLRGRS